MLRPCLGGGQRTMVGATQRRHCRICWQLRSLVILSHEADVGAQRRSFRRTTAM